MTLIVGIGFPAKIFYSRIGEQGRLMLNNALTAPSGVFAEFMKS